MGRLIEDISLRDRVHVFYDREEAGRLLAEMLREKQIHEGMVLAIPSGGVPVGRAIADLLRLPMDLLIARKVQIPGNTEAGFGAVGPDGEVILNEGLVQILGMQEEEIRIQINAAQDAVKERNRTFRGGMPFSEIKEKMVIVVDDGLASGYTMLAALGSLKKKGARCITIAVPTSSQKTIDLLLPATDILVCLNIRTKSPFAVADAYRKWYDLPQEEVMEIMGSRFTKQ